MSEIFLNLAESWLGMGELMSSLTLLFLHAELSMVLLFSETGSGSCWVKVTSWRLLKMHLNGTNQGEKDDTYKISSTNGISET